MLFLIFILLMDFTVYKKEPFYSIQLPTTTFLYINRPLVKATFSIELLFEILYLLLGEPLSPLERNPHSLDRLRRQTFAWQKSFV